MNKAKIISELENMVVARLFGRQPWLADRETCSAVNRKLIQMGLVEVVCVEPQTWRSSSLGKELDVELFEVFMGLWDEWEVPIILENYGLIDESEADVTGRLSPPRKHRLRLQRGARHARWPNRYQRGSCAVVRPSYGN